MTGLTLTIEQTMLIERLFGVGTYVAVLAITILLINQAKNKKDIRRCFRLYLVILCVMAFFVVPDSTKDLYRLIQMTESWPNWTLSQFIDQKMFQSTIPVSYLMMYLCRCTGFDGALPALACLIFYWNVFHIIVDSSERQKAEPRTVSTVLLFVMCSGTFLFVISNIRFMPAASIVVRCAYDEIAGKRSPLIDIPLYAIACLMHTAILPLVVIRFAGLVLFEKAKSKSAFLLNVAALFVLAGACWIYGKPLVDAVFEKTASYTSGSYSYGWEYLLAGMKYLLIAYVLFRWRNGNQGDTASSRDVYPFWGLSLLLLIVSIAFIGTYSIFHRYLVPCCMLLVPVIYSSLDSANREDFAKTRKAIDCVSICILVVACLRGDLCGYKFFLLS